MVSLLCSLPPELFNEILGYVQDSHSLLSLALCCCSMHTLVIPHLYSDIQLLRAWDQADSNSGPYPHLKALTLKFESQPIIASFVRSIVFHDHWVKENDMIYSKDPLIARLLHALPNLRRLIGSDFDSTVFQAAISQSPGSGGQSIPLQKLRLITCLHVIRPNLPMPPLSLWLQLRSIREIDLSISYSDEAVDLAIPPWACSGAATSTLKHLRLHQCPISNTDLTHILSACVSLSTLEYESVWAAEDSYEENDLPALLKALWATKQTLQNLSIDYWINLDWAWQSWATDYESTSPVPSLSKFQMLTHLRVGMFVFFGAADWEHHVNHEEQSIDTSELPKLEQLLPRSLQTIFFTHTQGRIGMLVGALANLLRSKTACVPRLQAISFEAHFEGNEHAPSLIELGKLAVATEVTFRAIDLPADEDRCYYYEYEDLWIDHFELELAVGFWPGVTSSKYFDMCWKPGDDFICKPVRLEIEDSFDGTESVASKPL
ncbi:MAG: hypothetical protein Q9184_007171 [Pyrenodesmia sp. 2 TL-2023]